MRSPGEISEKIYRKPTKGGLPNVLFVQAAVEALPPNWTVVSRMRSTSIFRGQVSCAPLQRAIKPCCKACDVSARPGAFGDCDGLDPRGPDANPGAGLPDTDASVFRPESDPAL